MEPEHCEKCFSHFVMSLEKVIKDDGVELAWRCEECGYLHPVEFLTETLW